VKKLLSSLVTVLAIMTSVFSMTAPQRKAQYAQLWIEHDIKANAKLKKAPNYCE